VSLALNCAQNQIQRPHFAQGDLIFTLKPENRTVHAKLNWCHVYNRNIWSSGFCGMEWWTGMVEWTGTVE